MAKRLAKAGNWTLDVAVEKDRRRLTQIAGPCLFFIPAIAFSPGPGSSLGMPWPLFFGTWGVMLVAAFISFLGYFGCKRHGQPISIFYAICPVLLAIVFLIRANLSDIIRAMVR